MFDGLLNQVTSWAVIAILGFIAGCLVTFLTKMRKQINAVCEGLRSLLRSDIVKNHHEYVVLKGSCPLVVKEVAARNYKAYHNLDGNDIGTALFQDLMDLPIKED